MARARECAGGMRTGDRRRDRRAHRHERGHQTPRASTTGPLAPITVKRPSVPIIAGGIPVDLEPVIEPKYFETALTFLPGKHRYRLTISNVSNLGAINSFQWYPPTKTHIVKLLGSSAGDCTLRGLTGFGGNQFPGLVLHQNVLCDKLDLKPPELHLPAATAAP